MEPEKRPIILIAEDDESNYLLLFALLKRDYQIIHAHDGIEAIQLFKNFPPDAILMEIDHDIPIIVVSAYAFEQDKQTAYSCGCNAYIMKPVDAKKLTSTISLLLSIKEHHISIH